MSYLDVNKQSFCETNPFNNYNKIHFHLMNQKQARKKFKCARLTYFIDFILSMLTQTTYIMQNFTIIFNGTILHTVVKARSK